MFNGSAFNYINVLDRAADATWMRQEAISNNIANATTPGYQRQDVAFESELKKALSGATSSNMDRIVGNMNYSNLTGKVYSDNTGFEYRLDGNNVDPETEQVALVENQLKYTGLIDAINNEFTNLKMVMK